MRRGFGGLAPASVLRFLVLRVENGLVYRGMKLKQLFARYRTTRHHRRRRAAEGGELNVPNGDLAGFG